MDLKNHDGTKKNREKKIDFQAQIWSTSNQWISLKFHMVVAICLNLKLLIHKKMLSQL